MKNCLNRLMIAVLAVMSVTQVVQASSMVPDTREVFGDGNGVLFGTQTELQDYSVIDDLSGVRGNIDPAYEGAYAIRNVLSVIVGFLEKIMVPVAIILLLWAAVSLLINRGDEEQFKVRIRQIVWTGAGFMLFVFSFSMVDYMFFGVQGQILQGDNFKVFGEIANREVLGLVRFVSSFVVALAMLFLVFGSIRLILLGENEEELSQIKKQLVFTILGILMIVLATTIASVFFAGSPDGNLSINSRFLIAQVIYWANILLGFIALGAVIAIIWAGIQMILHFGDEETLNRSKKIILYAIVGLVLAFSAFTIVRFFLTPGSYGDNDQPRSDQLEAFDRGVIGESSNGSTITTPTNSSVTTPVQPSTAPAGIAPNANDTVFRNPRTSFDPVRLEP